MGNLPILSSKLNIFYLFFWKKSFCQKLDTFHVLYFYIVCFFQGFQAHWWFWWNTWAGQLCQRHWRLHCRGPDGLPRRRSNQLSGQRSSECSWILVLLVRRLWRHCWPQPHVSLMIIISKYLFYSDFFQRVVLVWDSSLPLQCLHLHAFGLRLGQALIWLRLKQKTKHNQEGYFQSVSEHFYCSCKHLQLRIRTRTMIR